MDYEDLRMIGFKVWIVAEVLFLPVAPHPASSQILILYEYFYEDKYFIILPSFILIIKKNQRIKTRNQPPAPEHSTPSNKTLTLINLP